METPALSIHNLTKVYEDSFKALESISLNVKKGDFFALLGPNGAGKSTTIGIICSLVRKTEGKVSIFQYDVDKVEDGKKVRIYKSTGDAIDA